MPVWFRPPVDSPVDSSARGSGPGPGRRSRGVVAVVLTVMLVAAVACSSSKPSSSGTADSNTSDPYASSTTADPNAPGHSDTLPTGTATIDTTTTPLGAILVDGRGFTLYAFTSDGGGSSPCVDECAKLWPPLTGTGIGVAEGVPVQQGEFTLVKRPDGSMQVAVNGHPLYRYANDTEPGETTGQGVAGVWFVVGTDGKPITS